MEVKCPNCNGSGKIEWQDSSMLWMGNVTYHEEICRQCYGKGTLKRVKIKIKEPVYKYCKHCLGGNGKEQYETKFLGLTRKKYRDCSYCNGKGKERIGTKEVDSYKLVRE